MKVEELQKKKEEAEKYLKALQEDSEKIANAIQQIAGRIQMLNELIEEESEPVAASEEDSLPSKA